jgi:hypothetical protein
MEGVMSNHDPRSDYPAVKTVRPAVSFTKRRGIDPTKEREFGQE